MNLKDARPGQRIGIERIVDNARSRHPITPIILPTGYGKSDVIKVSAIEMLSLGLVSTNIVLSPNVILRDQIIDPKKFADTISRYQIDASHLVYRGIEKWNLSSMCVNGENFLSMTIQMANQHDEELADFCDHMKYEIGLPVFIHIDETQFYSRINEWGKSAKKWLQRGAILGLYTATPDRTDGEEIPGLPTTTTNTEPITVPIIRNGSSPELIRVDIHDGVKETKEIDRNFVKKYGVLVTFKEAWDENVICHVQRIPYAVELDKIKGLKDKKGFLIDLSLSETREALKNVIRDSAVVRNGCERLVIDLETARLGIADAAAIIFCGNDIDTDTKTNQHAKMIKKTLKSIAPELDCVIATSSDEDEGAKTIKSFGGGHGDVLIVKQMASLGLDIERLKVELDLSSVRAGPPFIQRLMRASRPYKDCYIMVYITPEDKLGSALYHKFIEGENGSSSITLGEVIRSFETERKEREKALFSVTGVDDADFQDSKGNESDKAALPDVLKMLKAFPPLRNYYTHSEIAKKMDQDGVRIDSSYTKPLDVGSKIGDLRQDCSLLVREITGNYYWIKYNKYIQERWADLTKDTWNEAKDRAGISRRFELPEIYDIRILQKLKHALEILLDESEQTKQRSGVNWSQKA